jgi:hypothetical protein
LRAGGPWGLGRSIFGIYPPNEAAKAEFSAWGMSRER